MSGLADILDRAADLISPKGAWTNKGYYAFNAAGETVEPEDPEAVCWCLAGAIDRVAADREQAREARDLVRTVLPKGRTFIPLFNDNGTQKKVVAKLREAAAKARAVS